MGFFSLLLFFSFFEWYRMHERKYLLLTGLFLGIHLLIKIRTILFVLPLFLYSFYKTKDIRSTFQDITSLCFFASIIFSIFPILVYLANPEFFLPLMERVIAHNTGNFSIFYKFSHLSLFTPIFILLSFLYPFLFLQGLFARGTNLKKKNVNEEKDACMLLLFWFVSLFLMFLAILPEGLAGAYPRYIAFLVPPLILLSARGFASLRISEKMVAFVLFNSILLSLVFLYLNQIASIPSGYWYFMTAAMGILKISKLILFFVFSMSCVLLILFFYSSSFKYRRAWISFFLILNIGFQILLITDPFIDQTHRKIITDFTTYYNQHDIKEPIFVWVDDLAF
jgi:hypothetical protein